MVLSTTHHFPLLWWNRDTHKLYVYIVATALVFQEASEFLNMLYFNGCKLQDAKWYCWSVRNSEKKAVDIQNLHGFGGFRISFGQQVTRFLNLTKTVPPKFAGCGGRGIHPPWQPAKSGESTVTLPETNIPPLKIDPWSRGDSELGNPCIFRGYVWLC